MIMGEKPKFGNFVEKHWGYYDHPSNLGFRTYLIFKQRDREGERLI